jgi:methionyl-tRNA formyltransferase
VRALGHDVVALVTARNPRNGDALAELVGDPPPGVDVLVPHNRRNVARLLSVYGLDLAICSGLNWKLPAAAIAAPRLGILNGHPSLLPRWRGPNPFGWTFRADEREIGFTWHLMDAELDTGPILAQGTVPLDDDDTQETLWAKLHPIAGGLLASALERLEAGDRGDPQPTEGATWAPVFEDEFTEIDWTRPARDVHNQVRSWFLPTRSGIRGAHTTLDGERVRVTRSQLVTADYPPAAPGTIVARENGSLIVQCGDGPLRVLETEPAGAALGSHP